MVSVERGTKPSVSYFFLNDRLKKTIWTNKSENTIVVKDMQSGDTQTYQLDMVEKYKQQAYTVAATARLLGKERGRIYHYIQTGAIRPPAVGAKRPKSSSIKYYSEDDVMEIRDFFSKHVHIGRPRKDGRVKNDVPSKEELRQAMNRKKILYVKNKDGEFVPTWLADW